MVLGRGEWERHRYQQAFVDLSTSSGVRTIAAFCGLQGGKTVCAADTTVELLYGPKALRLPEQLRGQEIHPEVWILSKSYVLASQAWHYFKWRASDVIMSDKECRRRKLLRDDAQTHWLKPSEYGDKIPIRLRVRTAHDPEQLRATGVLLLAMCDEIAHWPEVAWMNLQGRGIVTPSVYLITTTPKGKNWLYRDVYLPATERAVTKVDGAEVPYRRSKDGKTIVFQWSSADNPWADKEYLENLAKKFGPDYAAQELEGAFTSNIGYVYDFDRAIHCFSKLPSQEPSYYKHRVIGIDPGYGDPYACGTWLCDPDGVWWLAAESYEQKATFSDIYPWLDEQCRRWKIQVAYCDKRRPTDWIELHRMGIPAQANIEIHGETDRRVIMPQIRIMQTLLRNGRIKVHESCEWHCDEFENYAFPDREGKNTGDNPCDWRNHCLSGDSWIDCVDGRYQIKDLVGRKDVYVWAFDGETPRARRASDIRLTRKDAPVVKVTFDNASLILTADHLVMRKSGEWVEASKLKMGDRVRALYKSVVPTGYVHLRTGRGRTRYEAAHRLVWESINGPIPPGHIIHHKDENTLNNHPSNLELMSREDHIALHQPKWTAKAVKVRRGGGSWNKQERPTSVCAWCNKMFIQKKPRCSWRKTCSRKCHQGLRLNNHRVLSVEPYGVSDVYNMEVDGLHNFVANGVCVHNCMDAFRYAVASVESVGNVDGSPRYRQSGGRPPLRRDPDRILRIPSLAESIAAQEEHDLDFLKEDDEEGPVIKRSTWNPVR